MALALACIGHVHADWPLDDKLAACATRTDDGERLACFDALAESVARPAESQPDTGDDPPEDTTKPVQIAPAASPEPTRWRERIARIERQPRGEQVFFLANDQIWVELEPGRFRYQKDTEVIIEQTRSGGYILFTDRGRATRVHRLE